MTTIYIADNPTETLGYAGFIGDLSEEQRDALADAYGRAWEASARVVADRNGLDIEALVSADASAIHDHLARNGERDRADGPDEIDNIWQAVHDAVYLAIDPDEGWHVRSAQGSVDESGPAA